MIEYSATSTIREAFDRAHVQRGRALRDAWSWLFSPRSFPLIPGAGVLRD